MCSAKCRGDKLSLPCLGTQGVGKMEGSSANKFHSTDAVLQSWISL